MVQKSAIFLLALVASALAQNPISMITSMAGGGANPMGAIAGMASGLGAAGMMSQLASGNLDGPISAFIARLPPNVRDSPPVQRFISTVLPQIRRLAQMLAGRFGGAGGNPMGALASMASGAGGANPISAISSMASGAGGANPISSLASAASSVTGSGSDSSNPLGSMISTSS